MVNRASPREASHRAYHSGGSRSVIEKADDSKLMQEHSGNFMKGESRKGVESPQNYGFTSVVHPADKDKDGNIEMGAESFVSFMGGNRSFPVYGATDDRRHRLKELAEGDTAMFRGKDDRQQFHMVGEDKKKGDPGGNFMSCRDDRCQRFALVPKPQDDQQQAAPSQPGAQQRGQDDKSKKKPTGQKSALDDNRKSQVAIEQNGQTTFSQHGEAYASQKTGSDSTVHWEKNKKKSAQSTEKHTHIRFMDHRIWNEDEGNFWTVPCLVKKDQHCKEG